jgi:hypothetical protein
VFEGRSLSKEPVAIQVALVLKNGSSYGGILTLEPHTTMDYSLDLNSLQQVKTVTLPRPYPSFLPYFFNHTNPNAFNLDSIESLQLSIGPGIINERKNTSVAIGIVSIRLE